MKLYNYDGDLCENFEEAVYVIGTREEIENNEVDWATYSTDNTKEHLWQQTADCGHRWQALDDALLSIIQWQQYNK